MILECAMNTSHGAVTQTQGTNARTVNCGRVYSTCILKPVISGRNLWTRIILKTHIIVSYDQNIS